MDYNQEMKLVLTLLTIVLLLIPAYSLDWETLHDMEYDLPHASILASVEADPSIENKYMLGLSYIKENKYNKANEIFDAILNKDPSVFEAKWAKAEILQRDHRYIESELIFSEIIKKNPTFLPAYISLANIKQINGDYDKCLELSEKVIEMCKGKLKAGNYVRALCLAAGANGMIAKDGNFFQKILHGRNVLPYLEKAERLEPEASAVLYGMGSYYLLIPQILGRDLNKSEIYLRRLIIKHPNYANAYVRLAQIYKIKKNIKESKKFIDKASNIDPQNKLLLTVKQAK